jgi:hypothetical protein
MERTVLNARHAGANVGRRPVVLDVDASVGTLPDELRLPLHCWQEAVRFGCGLRRFAQFRAVLDAQMPARHGTVCLGSGDFHHVSWPLIERSIAARALSAAQPLRVVVLDNHPDNMRFPWGVHCGSWVRRVALHPAVSHVYVVGITSHDIGPAHAWENYLRPLRAARLSSWSVGVDTRWGRYLGVESALRSFASVAELTDALTEQLRAHPQPTYLSVDKDVFAPELVRTNWDQGQMQEHEAVAIIAALSGQIVGSDITGDVSSWRYGTWWKRLMSAGDGQDTQIDAATLATWQLAQHALNERLLAHIAAHCLR